MPRVRDVNHSQSKIPARIKEVLTSDGQFVYAMLAGVTRALVGQSVVRNPSWSKRIRDIEDS